MSSVIQNLKLGQIRIDGGTQPRTELNEATVAEYAESLTDSAKLPPVTVFYDGAMYWLADGFHRFFAHKKIDALDIQAEVHQGTKRDAILHSVGANDKHGLRRSNEDKRKAVLTLLEDSEWSQWSDNQISKSCGVSQPFVSGIRKSLITVISESSELERTYTTKHGTEAVMNTGNIGKKKDKPAQFAPKKQSRTLDSAPLPEEQKDDSDDLAQAYDTIAELAAENDRLMDHIAIGQMEGSDIAKVDAMEVMAELREQVKSLEMENGALKASRDTYMQKCAEMQKQINYWRRQAEKGAAA